MEEVLCLGRQVGLNMVYNQCASADDGLDFAKFVKLSAQRGQPVIGVGVKYFYFYLQLM